MSLRSTRTLVAGLAFLAVGGCADPRSDPDAPGASSSPVDEAAAPGAVTPAEYTTSVTFLAIDPGPTPALVLHLANRAAADGLHRRYLGWLLERSGWQTVLDGDWLDGPTRAPWRVIPGDGLQLIVSDDGELNALVVSSDRSRYALEIGPRLDGWEDRRGARHDIHFAQLGRRGQPTPGIMVRHRLAVPRPERSARFGGRDAAILRASDGTLLVLFESRSAETYGESFAWMYAEGLTRRWTALETRTVEVANSPQLRRNIPVRLWFHIPEPGIRGELRVTARELSELPTAEAGPKPYHAIYRVSGWLEIGEERQSVEGVLERGEP
jgi:hypothetical protein